MAADQLVDVDVDGDVRILLQIADMGAVGVGIAVNQPQFASVSSDAPSPMFGYSVTPR